MAHGIKVNAADSNGREKQLSLILKNATNMAPDFLGRVTNKTIKEEANEEDDDDNEAGFDAILGNQVEDLDEIEDENDNQKGLKIYSLLDLRSGRQGASVIPTKKETRLSPEDFQKTFGMDIEAFNALKPWKQKDLK